MNHAIAMRNYWSIPDDRIVKIFHGILSKWPACPICGGRYGYNDYSNPWRKIITMYLFCPKSDPQHFLCKFDQQPSTYRGRITKNKIYVKRRAIFSLKVKDYTIEYDTKAKDSDKVKVMKKMGRGYHELKLPFGSLDKWFVPHDRLVENLDKLFILL